MTAPGDTTTNTAESGATVGIQAEHVYNSNVYLVNPSDPPHRKYEVGRRFLEIGVPSRARELIGEAMASGHDNSEVRFYWVMAMLSKRSYRDLTPEERELLGRTSMELRDYADDAWKRALQAICELLECLSGAVGDTAVALKELLNGHPEQRIEIVRHLDLLLTGSIRDALWAESRQVAQDTQFSADRAGRAWAFFEPEPAKPLARRPANNGIGFGDWFVATICSAGLGTAVGYLGWLIWTHMTLLHVCAYVFALTAACLAARCGLDWRYHTERLDTKDRAYFGPVQEDHIREAGFARLICRKFDYYFAKYVPDTLTRDEWLEEIACIRATLRDEVVLLYQHGTIRHEQVNWLIRYLVGDIKKRWEAGTLLAYREQYQTTLGTKMCCVLGLASGVPSAIIAVTAAPLTGTACALTALATGAVATSKWWLIISERRRYAEDYEEFERIRGERDRAFRAWTEKVEKARPGETEMETWLNCDKAVILDDALRHYKLASRDILAHAFLQTPATYYKRARVEGGPWRYSRYDVRLFLITQDGVREVKTVLDFQRGELNSQERTNFRFDAVSSVQVTRTDELSYALELTLTNGPTRKIRITDPVAKNTSDEDTAETSAINLDAAGFTHALHILEGIAAEGKCWIDRDPHADQDPDEFATNA